MTTPSGPPYPAPPGPGSNAIGTFEVGIDPIGDIAAFSYWATVCSQYANSNIITSIIGSFFAATNQTANLDAFHDLIWNIQTAEGYGLDVWGRIVNVSRVLQIPSVEWFGFAEALPGDLSFNTNAPGAANTNQGGGTFYSGSGLTSNYTVSDDVYRRMILAKAATNITNCSIPAINAILLGLFPNRGNAYCTDGYRGHAYFGFAESGNALTFGQGQFYETETIATMVMTYTFNFPLSAVDYAIVSQSGILPKPAGVSASIVINAV